MEYVIDAKGKKIGRVASLAAAQLAGKHLVTYTRNTPPSIKVKVTNVAQLDISQSKRDGHLHHRHSQYRGGLTTVTTGQFIEKKGYKELMRKTIYGMLPMNKLRSKMIKNLIITE